MYDKKLVWRIGQYISENKFVDISIMAADLQLKYPNDYARRKKIAFKKLISQIYTTNYAVKRKSISPNNEGQSKKKKNEEKNMSFSEDISTDSDNLMQYKDTNSLNLSISNMYNGENIQQTPVKLSTANASYHYDQLSPPEPPERKSFIESNIANNIENSKESDDQSNFRTFHIDNIENGTKIKPRNNKKKRTNRTTGTQENLDTELSEFRKSKFKLEDSKVNFDNIGGNETTLRDVCKLLIHIKHPEIYQTLGVTPPHGVLLHGPPGCGKSLLANAIAGEMGLPMLKMAAPEIVSGISGESEQKLRDVFEVAMEAAPCIVFVDEIDAIAPKRENASKEQERRIVAQLLTCMDELSNTSAQVLIIGATNRPDALDPALRRAGRFDREISMGIPNEQAREEILKVLCKYLKLQKDFNFSLISRLTPGYVGADLLSLCREAAAAAVSRVLMIEQKDDKAIRTDILYNHSNHSKNDLDQLSTHSMISWIKNTTTISEEKLNILCMNMQDFEEAMKVVQPSAQREGFATVPNVTWNDIGALKEIRQELSMAILAPVKNPAVFAALGLEKPSGVLLAGPPGCGKTMLAKAIANESGINFISVKGPELLNMYVGESERAVRQCFQRAQNSSPCVIFFDELDSLCPKRSGLDTGSSARVVNQMLTEMDGLEARKQVFIMAATNRPDIIDPAILRPGRLDKCLFVDLPSKSDRYDILQAITKYGKQPLISTNLSLQKVAEDARCDRFTGADLSALVREASVNALKQYISTEHVLHNTTTKVYVDWDDFEVAFNKVTPSVSLKDEEKYKQLKTNKIK